MKWIKNCCYVAWRPQVLILIIAVLPCMAGLAEKGFHIARVNAVSSLVPPVDTSLVSELAPYTGINMPPKPLAFTSDCINTPCLALTFDDGPNPETTTSIVEALERNGAKATFFVIGSRIAGNEPLLRRMQNNGYEIGNHSWNHVRFTELQPEEMIEQVNKTQTALQAAGIKPSPIFRLPYGAGNEAVLKALPLPIVLWNTDPRDWEEKLSLTLVDKVMSLARQGSIIVMHDTEEVTAASIDEIIKRLQLNYKLVTVNELVEIPINSTGDTVIY